MKLLRITVLEKINIVFEGNSLSFVRGIQSTKEVNINYSNGTGQTLSAGQILYTSGTPGQIGYIEIKTITNYTLSNSGTITLSVINFPSSTEANKTVIFNFDNSPINLSLYYNSNPVTNDIIVQTPNRTPYIFSQNDFTSKITDYDNDNIESVMLVGDLTGFTLNNLAIAPDTWIGLTNIASGALKYTPLNQDAYYEKDIQYKAKDSNGNISIN